MKTGFFPKLAWMGIKNNRKLYIPYLLTCIGMAIGECFPEFDSLVLVDHTSPTLVLGGIAVVLLFASIKGMARL